MGSIPWYAYVGILLAAVIAYYITVDIKTRRKFKEKKAADRRAAKEAAKKSKSAKKRSKSKK